jgi:hypothetical protein
MCLYAWQRGGDLDTDRPAKAALVFIYAAAVVALFLLADALGTGTNLLDPSQWPKLRNSKGFLGFTVTAGGVFLYCAERSQRLRALLCYTSVDS